MVMVAVLVGAACSGQGGELSFSPDLSRWQQVADDAPWGGRAGLQVVELDGSLFLLGGRTPRPSTIPGDSDIWADVWRSDDEGSTWTELVNHEQASENADHWPARAYFQVVVLQDTIFVIGGQDYGLMENPFCELLEQGLKPPPGLGIDPDAPCPEFLPTSNFFNDVWASTDGISWTQQTAAAPWEGRAGLHAVALDGYLYVFGGSTNDDSSIIGAGGPQRLYFNDVWRSADGADWEQLTEAAPWEPRAGASVVAHDGAIWLFGGEVGFTCEPVDSCEPPYFNDVWRSTDGVDWEHVTDEAGWSPRPGHQCELLADDFVCFGGFGLRGNPTDVWASSDGKSWTELNGSPWAVDDEDGIRYDFASLSLADADGVPRSILTFGGDRETFDFDDPENYLRIEDDVWLFTADIAGG